MNMSLHLSNAERFGPVSFIFSLKKKNFRASTSRKKKSLQSLVGPRQRFPPIGDCGGGSAVRLKGRLVVCVRRNESGFWENICELRAGVHLDRNTFMVSAAAFSGRCWPHEKPIVFIEIEEYSWIR